MLRVELQCRLVERFGVRSFLPGEVDTSLVFSQVRPLRSAARSRVLHACVHRFSQRLLQSSLAHMSQWYDVLVLRVLDVRQWLVHALCASCSRSQHHKAAAWLQVCTFLPAFCTAFIEDVVGKSHDLNATRLPTYLKFVPAGAPFLLCGTASAAMARRPCSAFAVRSGPS